MDIVERLRQEAKNFYRANAAEAADEIERLREEVKAQKLALNHAGDAAFEVLKQDAEIERLREALRTLSEFDANPSGSGAAYGQCGEMVRLARSALQQKESE